MARPKKFHNRRITTAVRLPEDLHSRLSATAHARGTSVNHLMVLAAESVVQKLSGDLREELNLEGRS